MNGGSLRREWRGAAAMVVATLLWGATFVVIRDSLRDVRPAALVALRFAIAGPLLVVAAWAARARFDAATLRGGIVAGLFMGGGFLFQCVGLQTVRAGTSAFLTCLGTLAAPFVAWAVLGQRPGRVLVIGVAVAAVGAGLLSDQAPLRYGRGELWTLGGALLFAVQVVFLARYAATVHPLALTAVQCVVVGLVAAPFAGDAPAALARFDRAQLARLAYLGVAAGAIAPLLQVTAQRVLPAGRVGLLFALEPIFALAFALGPGRERFGAHWYAGAGLVLAAVVGVEWVALTRAARSTRGR